MQSEISVRFFAGIDEFTTRELLSNIDGIIQKGYRRIHLLISSPGGSVYHGLSLYNYLVSAPIELYTYNFGSVDSIGVILFCAGRKRFSVKHARFLLHPVQSQLRAHSSMDEKAVDEMLKGLKIDQANIAKVIASRIINKNAEEIEQMIHSRTTLSPQEVQDIGLIHEIKELDVPVADGVVSIFNKQQSPAFVIPQDTPGGFTEIESNYLYPRHNYTPLAF
ncbi:MAG: ClpP family protease [Salinispira sp.]